MSWKDIQQVQQTKAVGATKTTHNKIRSLIEISTLKKPRPLMRFKSDNYEMANFLRKQLQPVATSLDSNDNDIYGWTFRSGEICPTNKATEMNLFFLGTGSMPHFGKHQVMSESGDVLCHLARQKALNANLPSLIIKGIGTSVLNKNGSEMEQNYPLQSLLNPNIEYAGKMSEIMLGHGIKQRLKIAMEEFFIPNLTKMIKYNDINEKGIIEVDINVVGHSRGAINAFHLITAIESWLTVVQTDRQQLDTKKLALLCKMEESDIVNAIEMIKNNKVNCKMHSLSFDPVEGKCRAQEVKKWFSNDTSIPVNIEGCAIPIDTNCSMMPKSVARAEVFFAQSERRWDFRPTVPEFASTTQQSYKIQLGSHSTMTGNIGDADGTGQDAFETVKKYPFVKEAALATIDKVKLDAVQFLFKDKLPPLQRQTLRRIIRKAKSEQIFAYQNTLAYLNKELVKNLAFDDQFRAYAVKLIKILYPHENVNIVKLIETHADLRIRCCEWLMKHDTEITLQAYSCLEKDIQDMYLNSPDPIRKNLLAQWQEEIKRDSSTIIAGPLTGVKYLRLPLQAAEKEREIYLRRGKTSLHKQSLGDFIMEQNTHRGISKILKFNESHEDKERDDNVPNENIVSLLATFKKFPEMKSANENQQCKESGDVYSKKMIFSCNAR